MRDFDAHGLLVIWSFTDPECRVAYQKWHNCEHMTDRVTIPDIFVGYRYNGMADAPTFMMYYETKNAGVLSSEAYLRSVNNPSPWAREIIPTLKKTVRAIYRLVHSSGEKVLTESPFLLTVRFNVVPENEEEVILWLKDKQLPNITRIPGVHRARLFEVDDEISNMKTEERKKHGGGPGRQDFLLIYELATLGLLTSEEWQNAYQNFGDDPSKGQDVLKEAYWLDFVMYSPHLQS